MRNPCFVGVEIGELGAWANLVLGSDEPSTRWELHLPTLVEPDELVAQLVDAAQAIAARELYTIAGVSVAIWGHVDPVRGEIISRWPGDAWKGYPLRSRIAERIQTHVHLDAAIHAGAIAEVAHSGSTARAPFVYIHIGREITSAILWEGTPIRGAHNLGGQLGHWKVGADGPICSCGAKGHLNPIASSQALSRHAIGLAAHDDQVLDAVLAITRGRAETITAGQVTELASRGVEPLRALVHESVAALASALANLAAALDPEVIVLSGPAVGAVSGWYLQQVREQLRARFGVRRVASQVRAAALEPDSALIGAWSLARKAAIDG